MPQKIKSIEKLISKVMKDYEDWNTSTFPWFRGEPNINKSPLLPRLYRESHNENLLLQHFRMKAPSMGLINIPPRSHTDQWLFLAQHVGLPTRLLDWTEGLLVALYFAVHTREKGAVVWMLDPVELNRLSSQLAIEDNIFPLTWFSEEKIPLVRGEMVEYLQFLLDNNITDKASILKKYRDKMKPNYGSLNIRGAWENDTVGTELPIAIHPTHVHPRISTQKSCFTIQGKNKSSLTDLVDSRILKKYIIRNKSLEKIKEEIRFMGITNFSLFPDLDGLAKELRVTY